ncbi:MAG TPA: ELWxxDGT repeat protein [Polyangia bacterium]
MEDALITSTASDAPARDAGAAGADGATQPWDASDAAAVPDAAPDATGDAAADGDLADGGAADAAPGDAAAPCVPGPPPARGVRWGASAMAELGGIVYFTADDGVHGLELWRSGGTAAGTTLVADLLPGSAGSGPSSLVAYRGALFFSAAYQTPYSSQIYRLDP